jgi:hypothetical protein
VQARHRRMHIRMQVADEFASDLRIDSHPICGSIRMQVVDEFASNLRLISHQVC